jgi:hypothetical protein
MASGTGTYFAVKLLNRAFNAAAYTFATSIDLALYTTGGITAAGAGTEVSGTSYARLVVACNTTNFATTATNSINNAITLSFAAAGGAWTVASALAIYETTNNNLLFFGDLAATKTLSSGDVFQFTATNLTITQA